MENNDSDGDAKRLERLENQLGEMSQRIGDLVFAAKLLIIVIVLGFFGVAYKEGWLDFIVRD